ncbi:MAG: hypothetical protein CME63_15605 [Halobacteriovoraceae bacterium]|nr:hypothetical protein [Halobacteriovoraceae bacterium]|tara:strand:- start:202951 stop:203259 length:309 start_codon:yes stop_codon:yes gene_type:complete
MKKIFITFLMVVSTLSTYAYTFTANANVQVTPTLGTVQVYNHLNRPIICSGRADGVTRSGLLYQAFIKNQLIYPNLFAYMYVQTNQMDIFRYVKPYISCHTI